jgi:hypothetical protein
MDMLGLLGQAGGPMRTASISLRSKGRTIRVKEYEAPPRTAPDSFYTIQIVEYDRTGKVIQSMAFTPESADAVRRALNAMEADIDFRRIQR